MTEFEDEWSQSVADTAYVTQPHVPRHTSHSNNTNTPMYDGKSSWFAYEEAIDDWCDITELEPETRARIA